MDIRVVMLVDDEPDIRTVGRIAIEDVGGWQAVLAGSGLEACELAARAHPDVILLDVMMPGLDGVATLERLRASPASAGIPVVMLTAKQQRADVDRYRKLGVAGIIAKPFDPLTLPDELRRLLDS